MMSFVFAEVTSKGVEGDPLQSAITILDTGCLVWHVRISSYVQNIYHIKLTLHASQQLLFLSALLMQYTYTNL